MKKNIVTKAATIATALLMTVSFLSGCTGTGTTSEVNTDPNVKPTEITMMIDTCMTPENGLQQVADKYKENTGITLKLEKPDHNQYYEKVGLAFAGGTAPNVLELGSIQYPTFASQGALWNMADAYASSDAPVKSIIDEAYVDSLRIPGMDGTEGLYGFPLAKGGGTVTYVRQDWLDKLGLSAPTNYNEFLDMLRAFKTLDGRSDIIPITAAGLINGESPYEIYLREFYQDAKPYIYKDEATGKYVDGMSEAPMKEALQRMQDAYKEGLIDPEIVTNKTSTCRDKFYADLVGCFNYWAGSWAKTLDENLVTTVPDAKITALPAIAESWYIERPSTAISITSEQYTSNPIGIYKYFIEYMHDGGEGQMLFTRGVENVHWKKNDDGTTIALPYLETPDKDVEKSYMAPELSCTTFDDPIALDERVTSSLETFYSNRKLVPYPPVNDTINVENAELDTIRKEVISKVVLGQLSAEEGIKEYETRANGQISAILTSLNG